jgi:hypothetical protein
MMNPIGMVQQQQQAGAGLSIDQLLRAAKLIEQRAIVEKMMVQPSAIDQLLLGNSAAAFAAASAFSATKLGGKSLGNIANMAQIIIGSFRRL